jgi:hypothetical protein
MTPNFMVFVFVRAVILILPEERRHGVSQLSRSLANCTVWVAQGIWVQQKRAGSPRAKLARMRTPASVAACLLLVGSLGAWAQAAKFAGTWEAAHEGKVFLVLKVQAGQKISGTLNASSITLSDEGELIKAEPVEDRPAPFFFAKAEGDKLEFDYQDQGDDEIMHFELKLTGEDVGELRIVDEHIPKMKPFRLRKKAPARG